MSWPRGFSLLEVLIALSLLSLITMTTTAALRSFGNTKVAVTEITNRNDEMRVVSSFLRNALGSALPVRKETASTPSFDNVAESPALFWGGASEVIWVAPLVAGADLGGAFVFQLEYSGGSLNLRWYPYSAAGMSFHWEDLTPRVLLEDVEAFTVGYLAGYGDTWLDVWPESPANPVAVRLNIKSRGKFWPELIVRLDSSGVSP